MAWSTEPGLSKLNSTPTHRAPDGRGSSSEGWVEVAAIEDLDERRAEAAGDVATGRRQLVAHVPGGGAARRGAGRRARRAGADRSGGAETPHRRRSRGSRPHRRNTLPTPRSRRSSTARLARLVASSRGLRSLVVAAAPGPPAISFGGTDRSSIARPARPIAWRPRQFRTCMRPGRRGVTSHSTWDHSRPRAMKATFVKVA